MPRRTSARARLRKTARKIARRLIRHRLSPFSAPAKAPGERMLMTTSGLFDLTWYSAEAGEEFADLDGAISHYLATGAKQELSPNPLFDPSTSRPKAPDRTAFGSFLRRGSVAGRSPHPGWAIDAYLARHPEAADHPFGPLGHLYPTLGPDSAFDVSTPDGPIAVRWGDHVDRWRELATAWTYQRRLRRPGFVTRLPDGHQLEEAPIADASPETFVSVIIATWNREDSIGRTLASVRAQTWQHWEALVVDDGSDDDTLAVLRAISEDEPRIRVIPRPHEGVCAARNAGLAQARGGLIAFLDSDNEWLPTFLEHMVRAMQAGSLDAAYGTLMAQTPAGPRYRATLVDHEILMVENHVDLNVLIIRAALMDAIGGFDTALRRTVDYDLVLRIAARTKLVHVPVIGVLYDNEKRKDRISVREPYAWNDVVKLKHRIDWEHQSTTARDDGLLSVILPVHQRPDDLLARIRVVRESLGDTRWEAIVVDHTSSRALQNAVLSEVLIDDRIRYEPLSLRASYAYAADVGFALSRGGLVLFVDFDVVPDDTAIRSLLAAADKMTGPFILQPAMVDDLGGIVTAGGVLSPWHPLPASLLAGHVAADLTAAEDVSIGLDALDGRTFVTRAVDFVRVRGLDPLFDNELELTDLGLRLLADDADTYLGLVPTAQVRQVARTGGGNHSASNRQTFVRRHASAPADLLSRWTAREPDAPCD